MNCPHCGKPEDRVYFNVYDNAEIFYICDMEHVWSKRTTATVVTPTKTTYPTMTVDGIAFCASV